MKHLWVPCAELELLLGKKRNPILVQYMPKVLLKGESQA